MRCPNFEILQDVPGESLLIRDVGPWTEFPTVTNGAAEVVAKLVEAGHLPEGRRLYYIDSEGNEDEIVVKGGRFAGFAPGNPIHTMEEMA